MNAAARRRRGAYALALGAGVSGYLVYSYLRDKARKPTLQTGISVAGIVAASPALSEKFYPTPWATNRHAQTCLSVLRYAPRLKFDRQLLHAPDGGHVSLDWWPSRPGASDPLPADAPTFLICHGITGGSHESYVRNLAKAAADRGWRAVVLNYRGCGGMRLTSPRVYSAAMTDDVELAVGEIKAALPGAPLVAAGVSLGAMILTRYLGQGGGAGQLAGAASLSNPFCMHEGQKKIETPGMAWLYNFVIAYKLRQYAAEHRQQLEGVVDYRRLARSRSIRDFERHVILPVFGYDDLDHYYGEGSSQHHIPHIQVPTLFLIAEDDPFLGRIPWEEAAGNPHIAIAATARGGHVGFLEGVWPLLGRSYLDRATIDFLAACLEAPAAVQSPVQPSSTGKMEVVVEAERAGGGSGERAVAEARAAVVAASVLEARTGPMAGAVAAVARYLPSASPAEGMLLVAVAEEGGRPGAGMVAAQEMGLLRPLPPATACECEGGARQGCPRVDIVLMDSAYPHASAADRSCWAEHASGGGGGGELIITPWKGDLSKGSTAASLLRRVGAARRAAVLAVRPKVAAALRLAQIFEASPSIEALVLLAPEPPPREHAAKKFAYRVGSRQVLAAEVCGGGGGGAWAEKLCWALGGHLSEEGAVVVTRPPGAGGPPPPAPSPLPPVSLSVAEQLEAAAADLAAAVLAAPPPSLRPAGGGAPLVRLVASSAARFTAGGFSGAHYVRDDPNPHGAYVELEDTASGRRIAYAALSVYDPGKGVACPWAPPGRAHSVAQVDRLAVLPEYRRRGAAAGMLRALGNAAAGLGYPMRIRTGSEEARAAFDASGVLVYEGQVVAAAERRGVNKKRRKKVYVDVVDVAPGGGDEGGGEGDRANTQKLAAPGGDGPEEGEYYVAIVQASGAGERRELLARAIKRSLNIASPDTASKVATRLGLLGRAAQHLEEERFAAECAAQHAARGGEEVAALCGRCAAGLAPAPELVAAAGEVMVAARRAVGAASEEGHLRAAAAARLASAGSFAAAAGGEGALPLVGTALSAAEEGRQPGRPGSGGAGRGTAAGVAGPSRAGNWGRGGGDGGGGDEAAPAPSHSASAEAEAACAMIEALGRRGVPQGALSASVERATALGRREAWLHPRAAQRCAALAGLSEAGWQRKPRLFEKGVGAVRAAAAAELNVTLVPGRGDRAGWVFWYHAPVVRAEDGEHFVFKQGRGIERVEGAEGVVVAGEVEEGAEGVVVAGEAGEEGAEGAEGAVHPSVNELLQFWDKPAIVGRAGHH